MNKFSLLIFANKNKLFILFFDEDKKILFHESNHKNEFNEHFFKTMKQLLKKQNLLMSQIQNIYSGIGPGSFLIHREIVTFLKTIKILKKKCEIFTINNLIYQAGQDKKIITLMEANKKQHYIKIINNGKEIKTINILLKKDLNKIISQYPKYSLHQNFEGIDHWKQFEITKKKFKKVLNWKKLEPIEL